MTWLALTTVGLLGIIAAGVIIGRRPAYHRHRSLAHYEPALRQLADVMQVGSLYVIEQKGSVGFLQFTRGEHGLRFGLPDAPWSRNVFERVRGALSDAGVPTTIVSTGETPVPRFLQVDFGGSPPEVAARAVEVSRVAARAMGWRDEASFSGHYEGAADARAELARDRAVLEQLAAEETGPVQKLAEWQLRQRERAARRAGER